MSDFKLIEYFKNCPRLTTDVGDFTFEALVGQGGNAHVLKFSKGPKSFALKFLEHLDSRKLSRLKDEFFSAAQLPTHANLARNYHLDQVKLDGRSFSLIVMRLYGPSLKQRGPLPQELDESERTQRAVKLFKDLLDGIDHLHAGHVIHRDLKPENVFFDESSNHFVIGDLGIAHFSDEFPREAETRHGERLGNYLFSSQGAGSPGQQARARQRSVCPRSNPAVVSYRGHASRRRPQAALERGIASQLAYPRLGRGGLPSGRCRRATAERCCNT